MKITITLNGKEISKSQAAELIGEDRLENRIAESIEAYYEDPYELNTWMDGMEITVEE